MIQRQPRHYPIVVGQPQAISIMSDLVQDCFVGEHNPLFKASVPEECWQQSQIAPDIQREIRDEVGRKIIPCKATRQLLKRDLAIPYILPQGPPVRRLGHIAIAVRSGGSVPGVTVYSKTRPALEWEAAL